MITPHTSSVARPFWLLALQWLAAVLLFAAFSSCLLLYNLSGLTERDSSITLATTITTKLFEQSDLGNQINLDELRQVAATMPDTADIPLPQLPSIHLKKPDIMNANSQKLSAALFSQIAGTMYDQGVTGVVAAFTPDKTAQDNVAAQAAPLNLFTKSTHDLAHQLFVTTLVTSAVLALLLILLSTGWWRVINPGIVLLLVSPIGVGIALLLRHTSLSSQLSSLAGPGIAQTIGDNLTRSYVYAAVAGACSLALGIVGKIVTAISNRSNPGMVPPKMVR